MLFPSVTSKRRSYFVFISFSWRLLHLQATVLLVSFTFFTQFTQKIMTAIILDEHAKVVNRK